jgi:hypothetical protein
MTTTPHTDRHRRTALLYAAATATALAALSAPPGAVASYRHPQQQLIHPCLKSMDLAVLPHPEEPSSFLRRQADAICSGHATNNTHDNNPS